MSLRKFTAYIVIISVTSILSPNILLCNGFRSVLDPSLSTFVFGKRLENALITRLTSLTLEKCKEECDVRTRCLSVNYFWTMQVCEINHRNKALDNALSSNRPSLYLQYFSWSQRTSITCGSTTCSQNEKCSLDDGVSSNHHPCRISDCDDPPDVAYTDRDASNGIGIHSKVTYTCQHALNSTGKPYISCMEDGSWQTPSFQCILDCDIGWTLFDGSCYKVIYKEKSWSDSWNYCVDQNAFLAEITSAEEQQFLQQLINDSAMAVTSGYQTGLWLGGTDADEEGVWQWHYSKQGIAKDTSSSSYTNWSGSEPNNADNEEDCLHARREVQYKWNDLDCNLESYFMCEKAKA